MKDDKKKLLLSIKKALPHGAIQTIANKLDLDRDSVSGILTGKWNNQEVIDEAINIIEQDIKEKKAVVRAVAKAA